jgi:hypothetical protein
MYLLDSDTFIQAKNLYYGFDICPGFWNWIDEAVGGCDARSIVKVYDELVAGNDELAQRIKGRKDDGRFLEVDDADTQAMFREVAAAAQFLSGADPWLVAKARVIGATVVTMERPEPQTKRRVPLPNLCLRFGVPYIDTFALLRKQAASFNLVA